MSLDRLVEEIISEAMARGEFDNLPGRGRPLDLDAYFSLPEDERAAITMLRNAGFVPEEVQLLRDANELRQRLAACAVLSEQQQLRKALDEKILAFNLALERRRPRRGRR